MVPVYSSFLKIQCAPALNDRLSGNGDRAKRVLIWYTGSMNALTKEEQIQRLAMLRGWSIEEDMLVNHFSFKNFLEAMAFVNKVAELAEKLQHHPDITISYNKVRIATTTHDANGLTAKDFDLAEKIATLS